MKYPYLPKSNQKLQAGEYWNLPLPDGQNAFFAILDLPPPGARNRTGVFVGLLGVKSHSLELREDDRYNRCLWQSFIHIKAIGECGGLIRGMIVPIAPDEQLDSSGGPNCRVMRGYSFVRKATPSDIAELSVQSTSGYRVPQTVAAKCLSRSDLCGEVARET